MPPSKFFELGYVAHKSGHSRGSTVDVTLIEASQSARDGDSGCIRTELRSFRASDATETWLPFLDDGSVDMGTSFDLMDEASHHPGSALITGEAAANRDVLRSHMVAAGFVPYDQEWWHFTLSDEPFPDTYFDFDVL